MEFDSLRVRTEHAFSKLSSYSLFQGQIKFAYDFEQLLDDWVLIGFLVGNDFLPNLPHFHIGEVGRCESNTIAHFIGHSAHALGRLQEGFADAGWIHSDR